MGQPNPYEAPASFVEEEPVDSIDQVDPWSLPPLASRGTRWGAAFIDGLFIVGLSMAMALVGTDFDSPTSEDTALAGFGLVMLGFVVLGAINLYLLHKNGQTIGKKLLKIKIVRADRRSDAELWRIIVLRTIPRWGVQMIPVIGGLLNLTDVLFIFREDRKCVHDMIADTIVVEDNQYARSLANDDAWTNSPATGEVDSHRPIW